MLLIIEIYKIIEKSRPGKKLTTRMITEQINNSVSVVSKVSEKTVTRVLNFLRDDYGLDLEYLESEHRWHFYLRTQGQGKRAKGLCDFLPTGHIDDVSSVLIAEKALQHVKGAKSNSPLHQIGKVLAGNTDERISLIESKMNEGVSFHQVGMSRIKPEDFDTVTRCIFDRVELSFEYTKRGHTNSEMRLVHPYHVTCVDSVWYLIAHDCNRLALRIFALTRVKAVRSNERSFNRPANFSATEFLKDTFGVFRSEGIPRTVRIRFDSWSATDVRERIWHSTQTEVPLEDGGIEIQMKLIPTLELERWLLGWGRHATVLEPIDLAEAVRKHAREMLSNYEPAMEPRRVTECMSTNRILLTA